jgi:hypothetical protein
MMGLVLVNYHLLHLTFMATSVVQVVLDVSEDVGCDEDYAISCHRLCRWYYGFVSVYALPLPIIRLRPEEKVVAYTFL